MEESISRLGQTLASFCNGVESSCQALNQSLDRRAIPLDSASATFIQSLNRRVSSLSGELNLLETMSFGTVSFEELLGHCNQVYKKNQADLDSLTDRLRFLGCHLSSLSDDDVDGGTLELPDPYQGSVLQELEDDTLFGDSTCLANLGLSEACLATIASKDDEKFYELESNLPVPLNCYENRLHPYEDQHLNSEHSLDETDDVFDGDSSSMIKILEEDYQDLPSYMKSLVSWETGYKSTKGNSSCFESDNLLDLQTVVDKINSSIQSNNNTSERGYFHADELASMGLGPKGRSYLLMLVRMKRLIVETKDGSIFYKAV
ncbi:hypothetical protein V2J09_010156 [Rumex salicifolius]